MHFQNQIYFCSRTTELPPWERTEMSCCESHGKSGVRTKSRIFEISRISKSSMKTKFCFDLLRVAVLPPGCCGHVVTLRCGPEAWHGVAWRGLAWWVPVGCGCGGQAGGPSPYFRSLTEARGACCSGKSTALRSCQSSCPGCSLLTSTPFWKLTEAFSSGSKRSSQR